LIERELASIIKYVLDKSEHTVPYYHEIPNGFCVPSVYFPVPEVETGNDTLSTYKLTYIWFIKFFHRNTKEAYQIASKVLKELKSGRNQIPVVNENGVVTSKFFYIKNPDIKTLDSGTVQLTVEWDSREIYTMEAVLKMQRYYIGKYVKR